MFKKILSTFLTLCIMLSAAVLVPHGEVFTKVSAVHPAYDRFGNVRNAANFIIDPGHGGSDPGACACGRRECDDVLRLSLRVAAYIDGSGATCSLTRVTDVFDDLIPKCQIANNGSFPYFLSIHRNAGGGTGVETYYYNGCSSNSGSAQLATSIQNHVIGVGCWVNRGVKTANYCVLRETYMDAALVEMGFIDTPADNSTFDNYIEANAKAIANGLLAMIGKTVTGGGTTPPTPPSIDTSYAGDYRCTASPNLRIRNGPGTGYTEIGNIPLDATVHVDGRTPEGWAKLTYGGVTGYSSMDYLERIQNLVTAPAVSFSGGTAGSPSYTLPYNKDLVVSWPAVANATKYDYYATYYKGEWSATACNYLVNSSTTGTSFTVPGQGTGKYIYVTVTAVGPANTATTQSVEVLLGPWADYPANMQYIPVKEINGSENTAGGSTVWTKDKGKAFPAKFWRTMLCSPNADGTYTVNSICEDGDTKSVEVSGTNILFAIHSSCENFNYAKEIVVGDKLTLVGIYLDANKIRGNGYILVNGGKSLAVSAPVVTCPSEIEHGSTASVSWAACENAESYDYKVTNGGAVVTEATGVTERSFTIPAVTSGTSLTVTVTAVGPVDSKATTKAIVLKVSTPTDITSGNDGVDKTDGAFRGIQSGQNVTAVLACFEQETEYLEVCSSDGTKLGDDAPVGTGCTVRIVNTNVSYVLIVIGDISGDGDISTADYAQQKNSLKGVCALEGAYNQAADINNDGICSALDIAALKFLIEG